MRAATELATELVDLEHADEVAVLLFEERQGADLGGISRVVTKGRTGWFSTMRRLARSSIWRSSAGVGACRVV